MFTISANLWGLRHYSAAQEPVKPAVSNLN